MSVQRAIWATIITDLNWISETGEPPISRPIIRSSYLQELVLRSRRVVPYRRIVGHLAGAGTIRAGNRMLPIRYALSIYQDFVGDVPGSQSVSGRLLAKPAALFDLVGVEVTLELEDKKKVAGFIADLDGRFRGSGPITE
jgi:hypothetical protein